MESICVVLFSSHLSQQVLPKKYYHHWLLLVNGISLLMGSAISVQDLEHARLCLMKFVHDLESLYGIEHLSYNVHLLTHLSQCVKSWGPLWAT
jgi:hypothetical protein